MKKNIEARIKIPLYSGDLIIVQSDDIQKVLDKYGVKFDVHGYEAVTFRHDTRSGYTRYVIAFENPVNSRIVAHESLHVVTYLFEDRGMRIDNMNDEPAAYLLGWVVGQIHKRIKIDDSKL